MPHVVGLCGLVVAIMDYLIDSMDEEYTSIPGILELYCSNLSTKHNVLNKPLPNYFKYKP